MNGLILFLAASLGVQNGWTDNQTLNPVNDSAISQNASRYVVFKQIGSTTDGTQPRIAPATQFSFNTTPITQPQIRFADATTQQQQQQQQQTTQQQPAQQQQTTQQHVWINPNTNQTQTLQNNTTQQQPIPTLSTQPQTQTNQTQPQLTTINSHSGITSLNQGTPDYRNRFSALQSNQAATLDTNQKSSQYLGLNQLTQPPTTLTQPQPNASFSSFGQQPLLNQQQYQYRQQTQQIPAQQQSITRTITPNQQLVTTPYQTIPVIPNRNIYGSQFAVPGYYTNAMTGYLQNQAKSDKDSLVNSLKEALKPMNEKIAALEKRALKATPVNQVTPVAEIPVKKSNSTTILWLLVFGLVGACFYLAWVAQTFYHRYRSLSGEMRETYLERGEMT